MSYYPGTFDCPAGTYVSAACGVLSPVLFFVDPVASTGSSSNNDSNSPLALARTAHVTHTTNIHMRTPLVVVPRHL